MGYISNLKTEVKKESILLMKKIFLYLMKHVFDYSINDSLKRDFSNIVKLIRFFKNSENDVAFLKKKILMNVI